MSFTSRMAKILDDFTEYLIFDFSLLKNSAGNGNSAYLTTYISETPTSALASKSDFDIFKWVSEVV